ncbi:hypothetical protein B0H12DRAFT_1118248, partial [Mycena haematopus]
MADSQVTVTLRGILCTSPLQSIPHDPLRHVVSELNEAWKCSKVGDMLRCIDERLLWAVAACIEATGCFA